MSTMLKLSNITKTFNPGTVTEKKAIRGIDLELEDGDFVTIIVQLNLMEKILQENLSIIEHSF